MHTFSFPDIRSRIIAIVEDLLRQNVVPADVIANARLADIGLASMDMVNLMLRIEVEFDVTITQADLTPETFQTVDTIAKMIVRRCPQDVAA